MSGMRTNQEGKPMHTVIVTPEEVAQEQAKLRRLGIAEYHQANSTGEKTEVESIKSDVRASWSTKYAAVLDPYSKSKARRFRIFQLDPEDPSIPMGYVGMPTVVFECIGIDPRNAALTAILAKFKPETAAKLKGRKPSGADYTDYVDLVKMTEPAPSRGHQEDAR